MPEGMRAQVPSLPVDLHGLQSCVEPLCPPGTTQAASVVVAEDEVFRRDMVFPVSDLLERFGKL